MTTTQSKPWRDGIDVLEVNEGDMSTLLRLNEAHTYHCATIQVDVKSRVLNCPAPHSSR